jgi:hypothetical protein
MFKLDENDNLVFDAKDLKEVYEPIVSQYGFEYEAYIDQGKRGLVWTKLYEGDDGEEELWPTMVIRESYSDYVSSPEKATYFSTSLWWECCPDTGLMISANSKEWEDYNLNEVELLVEYARKAKKEVNKVLEECRKQLVVKLAEIKDNLIEADGPRIKRPVVIDKKSFCTLTESFCEITVTHFLLWDEEAQEYSVYSERDFDDQAEVITSYTIVGNYKTEAAAREAFDGLSAEE